MQLILQVSSYVYTYTIGITPNSIGNVYIADLGNHAIRKITTSTGIITTVVGGKGAGFSGNGDVATSAKLNNPQGVTVDSSGRQHFSMLFDSLFYLHGI